HRDGAWIAGYLAYELGAALTGQPSQPSTSPLLLLGIYDAPSRIELVSTGEAHLSPLRSRISQTRYDACVAAIQQSIFDGDVYQVNLTVPFDARYDGDPWDLYVRLAKAARAPHCSYIEDEDAAFLSLSPELFLRMQHGELLCKPMKGTAPLDDPQSIDSEKNRAEHLMIVDLVRNDFHRIAKNVRVVNPFAKEQYPTFVTMTSEIHGSFDRRRPFSDLLKATFPCGSITGAPKEAAMRAIAGYESGARRAYCGSFGYRAPNGDGEWNVAIRTLQLETKKKSARFDVGGGIVADSNASDEWQEILVKSRFLESATEPLTMWETFAADGDRDAHVHRLLATAVIFDVPLPAERLMRYLAGIPRSPATLVRLRAHRDGSLTHTMEALLENPNVVSVLIADEPVDSSDPFLAWKTSWRPVHRRAFALAIARNCFDALLTNERGEITEGTRTTVFIERDGRLHTPPLECGLLPGVLRAQLIASGRAVETRITPAELRTAQTIFVGNAARGLIRAQLVKES
ncbi:MAG: chorismate-binding protein, partial [Vulcanimicrobiaceae bacterium]